MSDDTNTPPTGVPIWATERECYARHLRTNERINVMSEVVRASELRLVELVGTSGGAGRVRTLEREVAKHDERISKTERAVAMGYVIAGVVAAVGASLLTWLTKSL